MAWAGSVSEPYAGSVRVRPEMAVRTNCLWTTRESRRTKGKPAKAYIFLFMAKEARHPGCLDGGHGALGLGPGRFLLGGVALLTVSGGSTIALRFGAGRRLGSTRFLGIV